MKCKLFACFKCLFSSCKKGAKGSIKVAKNAAKVADELGITDTIKETVTEVVTEAVSGLANQNYAEE